MTRTRPARVSDGRVCVCARAGQTSPDVRHELVHKGGVLVLRAHKRGKVGDGLSQVLVVVEQLQQRRLAACAVVASAPTMRCNQALSAATFPCSSP